MSDITRRKIFGMFGAAIASPILAKQAVAQFKNGANPRVLAPLPATGGMVERTGHFVPIEPGSYSGRGASVAMDEAEGKDKTVGTMSIKITVDTSEVDRAIAEIERKLRNADPSIRQVLREAIKI